MCVSGEWELIISDDKKLSFCLPFKFKTSNLSNDEQWAFHSTGNIFTYLQYPTDEQANL